MLEETKKLLFSKNYTIRWDDMDAFNHVNHATYFVYMQECRIDWLRQYEVLLDPTTIGPVVSEIACKYLRPITYPAELKLELYLVQKEGKKIFFEQVISDKNNPKHIYAIGNVTVVWVEFATGRSILPPEQYDHILENTIISE